MRIAALLLCFGCWSAPPAPRTTTVASAPPANRVGDAASTNGRVRTSVWEGTYVCAQGVTALRLTLTRTGESVDAMFEFGPHDTNPSVPHGVYRLKGTATPDGRGGRTFTLEPDAWIEQPQNYEMVGLIARSTDGGRRLRGRIAHLRCGELDVTRIDR